MLNIRKSFSKFTKLLAAPLIAIVFLSGCASPASEQEPQHVRMLQASPSLSPYNKFELSSQPYGTWPVQKTAGTLVFKPQSASFDLHDIENRNIGRWYVQPEECRDDSDEDCQRRFAVTGQINALNATLSCYIQVRNDVSVGYAGQSLSGLCQDKDRRSFAITIYSN